MGAPNNILLFAGFRWGLACLKTLHEMKTPPAFVVICRDDEHEREKRAREIAEFCCQHAIPFQATRKVSPELSQKIMKEIRPDLILVSGWRTLLPKEVIETASKGAVGLHASHLPKYRGFAPVSWVLINGERETGVTLYHIAEGVDEGDIVGQNLIEIGRRETSDSLIDKIVDAEVELIKEYVPQLLKGTAPRRPQDHSFATYGCRRTPEDGLIDWSRSSQEIDRLIRGLAHPFPGAHTVYGGKPLIIWSAELPPLQHHYAGSVPGRVIQILPGQGVKILTGEGEILIKEVEYEGARMSSDEILFSLKTTLGRG